MPKHTLLLSLIIVLTNQLSFSAEHQFMMAKPDANIATVKSVPGLIAFWDFHYRRNNQWASYSDPSLSLPPYPVHLRRIGDDTSYSPDTWPYTDPESAIVEDPSGPFGKAIRFNKGHIYGAIDRKAFDQTPLDLNGKQPFTLIAWVKFTGERHMVAGIWDEGGWNKYGGRRQVALFAGLFGQRGVISHLSATGAASYPQSEIPGSQYARCRAIDGAPFADNQWIAMATTYDPERNEVIAYLNGKATPLKLTDPVARDVLQPAKEQPANPYRFPYPIYSPGSFVIKYNGYTRSDGDIAEHRLLVDLVHRRLTYQNDRNGLTGHNSYRVFVDIQRQGSSILPEPIHMNAIPGMFVPIPDDIDVTVDDTICTWLKISKDDQWEQIGTTIRRKVLEGAPFTFGRALGLGSEDIESGSELFIDGVAVFNRVLHARELEALSFRGPSPD